MSTRLLVIAVSTLLILGGAFGITMMSNGASETGGKALIGGPFSLVDETGERVTEKDFEGSYMVAYFGYTFCPDFCPLGLSTITEALEILDEDEADAFAPVFFSVDPARDTVEQLADYVSHFHPRMKGLTGTDEEVAAAAKAYRVYYAVPEEKGEDYPVDHSTFIYLMGPDGTYRTHFRHDATPEEIAERLRTELKNS